MQNVFQLRDFAAEKLFHGDYPRALFAYATLVRLQPNDLEARLRVADTLLAMGEVPAAAFLYVTLSRHAANGGHPLLAMVAIKILEQLDVSAADQDQRFALIDAFAAIYSAESERIGRGSRLSLADESLAFPESLQIDEPPPLETLLPQAAQIAADLSSIAAYPEKVAPIPLLSQLPRSTFAQVLSAVDLQRVKPGEFILQEGDEGDAFYLIARGSVEIVKGQSVLATLHAGAFFGEMALVSSQPRSASARAEDDVDLLRFDRDALRAAADQIQTLASALDAFTRERLLTNLMEGSPIFRPLDRTQRIDLIRHFKAIEFPAGSRVIEEGQPGVGLYLVLSGKAQVSKRDGDRELVLATLEPGSVFGEISLLFEEPTSASVMTPIQSTLLFLEKTLFQRLINAIPAIRDYIESLGDERSLDTQLMMGAPSIEIELDFDDL